MEQHEVTIEELVNGLMDHLKLIGYKESTRENVKSESKDGLSVSFVVARKDGETADDYVKRCMYQVIRIRLLPTGWLSRKAGCRHDHKCGCCDCL
ncbi:hypothetical protein IMSAGC002_03814 [Lachnospiraceae bacterium]|nr:hypothetical protein IMSAGC002_03814 [Lachnospiraceae bacterium]